MTNTSPANFPYSLVATDLDGTLLRSDGTISERTEKIVADLEASGVTFVLVTARPPRVVTHIAWHHGLKGLAICCNGAVVYDLASEKIVRHNPISHEMAAQVAAAIKAAVPGVSFAWERGLEFGCEPGFAERGPIPAEEITATGDFEALVEAPFTKLIALHPDLEPDALLALTRRHAGSDVTITHSGAPFIEISASGVDKASALLMLADELSIPLRRVIAFGDMPNDLPMLSLAGYSVAVAKAHPSVLAQADEVTLSNDQDGVAATLERLFRMGG